MTRKQVEAELAALSKKDDAIRSRCRQLHKMLERYVCHGSVSRDAAGGWCFTLQDDPTISIACREALIVAKRKKNKVYFYFNNIKIVACPKVSIGSLVTQYEKDLYGDRYEQMTHR